MHVPLAPDPVDPEENPTAQIVREAVRFVEQKRDQPYLLWLSIPDPHPPYMVAEPWASMYDATAVPPPAWREGEMSDKPYRQQLLVEWDRFNRDYPGDDILKLRRIYWGMVSCIDEHVGRLLATLERTGGDENTIVVFTADHGDYMGDHRMIRKSVNLYEALVHVPLIIRGPGIAARPTEAMVENVDILPTLAELAGVASPKGVQGRSFASVLRGERASHRSHVCLEHGNPGPVLRPGDLSPADHDRLRPYEEHHLCKEISSGPVKCVRSERWKFCMTPGDVDELYDLQNDPHELVNLARDPRYAEVCVTHRQLILDWLIASEDSRWQP
jgi:arylsulfatase A-like enzyme